MWILITWSQVPNPQVQGWVMFVSVFCFIATTALLFLYVIGAHGSRTFWINLVSLSPRCSRRAGGTGSSPLARWLFQCWVRCPVDISHPHSKAELARPSALSCPRWPGAPAAARQMEVKAELDCCCLILCGLAVRLSPVCFSLTETSSPATLPVPPPPVRGPLASPTTQESWLPSPGACGLALAAQREAVLTAQLSVMAF